MNEIEEFEKLHPTLSPTELIATRETLDRYLSLVWEIMEDERLRAAAFSESTHHGTIQGKVDSPTN